MRRLCTSGPAPRAPPRSPTPRPLRALYFPVPGWALGPEPQRRCLLCPGSVCVLSLQFSKWDDGECPSTGPHFYMRLGPTLSSAQHPQKLSEPLCSALLPSPSPFGRACLRVSSFLPSPLFQLFQTRSPVPPQHPYSHPSAPAPPAGCQCSASRREQGHCCRASGPHRGPSAPRWVPLWLPSSCLRSQPKKIISNPGWGRGSFQPPCPSPPSLPGWPHCLLF